MAGLNEPFADVGGSLRKSFWCPWPESNQHSLRNSILSRARLPIPPQGPLTTLAFRPTSRSRRNIAGGDGRSTREPLIETTKTLRCERACLDSAASAG
jgi:hypothetical protein